MAGISEVAETIHRIADGFVDTVSDCMAENRGTMTAMIKEQIYSGLDSNGDYLNPTYDNDPYFNEPGRWQGKAALYKAWKMKITPPIRSYILNLPPRPDEVPNLFITGTFFDSIGSEVAEPGVITVTSSGFSDGADIVEKYGDGILNLGYNAKAYMVEEKLRPWLVDFFEGCGYK